MRPKKIELELQLGFGETEAKPWECDFSYVSFFFGFILLSFSVHTD